MNFNFLKINKLNFKNSGLKLIFGIALLILAIIGSGALSFMLPSPE